MVETGKKAPQFTLLDQNGQEHSLSDYLGKWLLIYFYPKDDTPGCTKEACAIRDVYHEYTEAGMDVVGISADSVESHKKFAEKYSLPFTLLADEEKEVVETYGVWQEKSMFGKKYFGVNRTSFLINPDGKVAKIYPKVKPEEHAEQVLRDVENLKI